MTGSPPTKTGDVCEVRRHRAYASVDEKGLRERLELDSLPEVIRLVGQYSLLVVIAGIVSWLIAA
jgi:hydrogenase maturation factor